MDGVLSGFVAAASVFLHVVFVVGCTSSVTLPATTFGDFFREIKFEVVLLCTRSGNSAALSAFKFYVDSCFLLNSTGVGIVILLASVFLISLVSSLWIRDVGTV